MPEMFEGPLLAVVARDTWQSQTEGMIAFARDAYSMKLCDFASLAWVIYDWLFTLEAEVKYIWRSANTPPKILYLVSRYLGLVIVIPTAAGVFPFYCYSRLLFSSMTYHLLFYAVEFSMMIRVYALWGQKKRVAFVILVVFLLLEALNVTLLAQGLIMLKALTVAVPSSWSMYVGGCVNLKFPTIWRYCWLPDLIFNTVMFFLSCIRCMPYRSLPDAPLVTRVFRDGAVFYLCMLLFFLLFTIGLLAGDVVPYLEPFVPSVLSILSAHLLLSIRAYVDTAQQTTVAATTSPLDFDIGRSTAAGSYELGARTARTGRSTTTNRSQTITIRTVATEVLGGDADVYDRFGQPTLSFNAGDRDLENAEVDDDDVLEPASRSRRFNGFSEWIVAE